MRLSIITLSALWALPVIGGSAGCKNDACYKAVSGKGPVPIAGAVRKLDCQGVLQPVSAKAVIVTVSKSTTIFSTTVTITTQSDSAGARRRDDQANAFLLPRVTDSPGPSSNLLPRAQLNNKGQRPAYAAAACKNLQGYATACLCWGAKPSTVYPTRTVTALNVIKSAASTTVGFDFVSYLREDGQDFCTSFNAYEPPRTTITTVEAKNEILRFAASATLTTTTTDTQVELATQLVPRPGWKRALGAEKRDPIAIPKPSRIAQWDDSEISAVCSLIATDTVTVRISSDSACHIDQLAVEHLSADCVSGHSYGYVNKYLRN